MADSHVTNEPVANHQSDASSDEDSDVDPGPPKDEDRDAASAGTRRRTRQEDEIQRIIEETARTGANSIDLSGRKIEVVPDLLLEVAQIQYLYLESNKLTGLPHTFFDCLPNLSWLDLRRNYLQMLPSAYVGSHRRLRTLLLESNNLKTLPLELGLIPTLTGLNLANNPLEFPPAEIVEKGAQAILQFFRDMLDAKSQIQGRLPTEVLKMEELRIQDGTNHESSGSEAEWESQEEAELSQSSMQHTALEQSGSDVQLGDLVGPVPQSASLHQPQTYVEFRQRRMDRLQQVGRIKKHGTPTRSGRSHKKLHKYHEPLPPDIVEVKREQERRDTRLREKLEKQDLILQRRKDDNVRKDWRDETRKKQREKYRTRMSKGIDYDEPVKQAPFDIDVKHLKVLTNEERIAQEVRATHERLRQTLSPRSRQEIEIARAERARELERKIKLHMIQMQDRRRKPKGTPQEEMEAARKDLQIAENLQRQLANRRKELEYRFQAFTGGI